MFNKKDFKFISELKNIKNVVVVIFWWWGEVFFIVMDWKFDVIVLKFNLINVLVNKNI